MLTLTLKYQILVVNSDNSECEDASMLSPIQLK